MGSMLDFLKELLDDATERLPGVTTRRAFGSWGYYVDDRIFALAYAREDRLGVKLPEAAADAAARALGGASEWAPHGSPMSGWVLLPEELHDDRDAVRTWVSRAFELARATPASAPKAGKPSKARAASPSKPTLASAATKASSKSAASRTKTTKRAAGLTKATASRAKPTKPAR